MVRWLKLAVGTFSAAAGVFFVTSYIHNSEVRQLAAQVDQLERDRERLLEYARRLSATRRVAQIEVIDQTLDDAGRTTSTILWQEVGRDGMVGSPQYVSATGDLVYFEAAVIKFQEELVGKGEGERGASLAMFRRVFGDQQPAAGVAPLDQTALLPTDGPAGGSLEKRLWELFWQMMDDPAMAANYGVRVAQCEAPAVVLRPGQIWEITLDADGGLNLRIIGRRDIPGHLRVDRPSSSS